MIKELQIDRLVVGEGNIVVDAKATTENGDVGMRFAFPLKTQKGISAAVKLLEDAVDEAIGDLQKETTAAS